MPGDDWQKFANLRAYYGWMWTFPGKKLLFMGDEIAQWSEWNNDVSLNWALLDIPAHKGIQTLTADLNRLYVGEPALHATDADPAGFRWAVGDDARNSIFAFIRQTADERSQLLVVSNMTPVPRHDYRIRVPKPGTWHEVLNTDAGVYGGGGVGNGGGVTTEPTAQDEGGSLSLTIPPLATIILRSPASSA